MDGGALNGWHRVPRQRSPLWPPPLLLHWSLPAARCGRDAHLRVGRLAAWPRSLELDRPRRRGGKLFPRLRPRVDLGEVRDAGSPRRRLTMLSSAKSGLLVAAGLTGAAFLCPLCGGGIVGASVQTLGIAAQSPDTATVRLHISKMTCGSCPTTARLALKRLKGVYSASVTLDDSLGVVRYDPRQVNPAQIAAHLTKLTGFGATILTDTPKPPGGSQ